MEPQYFTTFDGLRIAFYDTAAAAASGGAGEAGALLKAPPPGGLLATVPVFLIHGFAGTVAMNWVDPGHVAALQARGRRVIGIDLRGHGRSDALAEIDRYEGGAMSRDCRLLLEHVGVRGPIDVAGYSMGCEVAMFVALEALAESSEISVRRLVLAGNGDGMAEGWGAESEEIALAFLNDTAKPCCCCTCCWWCWMLPCGTSGLSPKQRAYRGFLQWKGGDRKALAAVATAWRDRIVPAERWPLLSMPTLLLTGREDTEVVLDRLAAALPRATVTRPPGDHLSVVAAPEFQRALLDFLCES